MRLFGANSYYESEKPKIVEPVPEPEMIIDFNRKSVRSIFLHLLTFCSAGTLFLLAVFFFPHRWLVASAFLFLLPLLLNFIPRLEPLDSHRTVSVMEHDYELAKRKWKKEMEEQGILPRRQKGILPDSYSSQASSGILRLVRRSKQKEAEHRDATTRLKQEINDQILENRIRNEFSRIKNADPERYKIGIRKIRKLLQLRNERLIC